MSNYDEQAALKKALREGIPRHMVDALTGKFPTHADAEERREKAAGIEKALAARMHTYGENCPHCDGGYCLAFPNWSQK